jgi:DNA repair exonuclease SbcCD ATPase subunit
MTIRTTHSLAIGLLCLAISTTGCAARSGDREEIPHSSRDQFAQQLEVLQERIERLDELSGNRAAARRAALVQHRAELERRLDELDEEAPSFAADRQLVEDDLFQLEADVATLQRDLQAPVRAAQLPSTGTMLPGATGG